MLTKNKLFCSLLTALFLHSNINSAECSELPTSSTFRVDSDLPSQSALSSNEIHIGDFAVCNTTMANTTKDTLVNLYVPNHRDKDVFFYYISCPSIDEIYIWDDHPITKKVFDKIEIAPGDTKTVFRDMIEFPPLLDLKTNFWQQIINGKEEYYDCVFHIVFRENQKSAKVEHKIPLRIYQRSESEMKIISDWFDEFLHTIKARQFPVVNKLSEQLPSIKTEKVEDVYLAGSIWVYPFVYCIERDDYPCPLEKWQALEKSLTAGTLRDMVSVVTELNSITQTDDPEEEAEQIHTLCTKIESLPKEFRGSVACFLHDRILSRINTQAVYEQTKASGIKAEYYDKIMQRSKFDFCDENMKMYFELITPLLPPEVSSRQDEWIELKSHISTLRKQFEEQMKSREQ